MWNVSTTGSSRKPIEYVQNIAYTCLLWFKNMPMHIKVSIYSNILTVAFLIIAMYIAVLIQTNIIKINFFTVLLYPANVLGYIRVINCLIYFYVGIIRGGSIIRPIIEKVKSLYIFKGYRADYEYMYGLMGSITWMVHSYCDSVDGIIARISGTACHFGERMDHLVQDGLGYFTGFMTARASFPELDPVWILNLIRSHRPLYNYRLVEETKNGTNIAAILIMVPWIFVGSGVIPLVQKFWSLIPNKSKIACKLARVLYYITIVYLSYLAICFPYDFESYRNEYFKYSMQNMIDNVQNKYTPSLRGPLVIEI